MEKWQFNVLFIVGVGGAVLILLGPDIGLKGTSNPGAFTGVGAILTYVLTQRDKILDKLKKKKYDTEKEDEE